jgi:CubicO group peptidase (beta-lactamase class C family)
MNLPMAKAAAGWVATAPDMVRFLTALDGSRGKKFLKDETYASMVASPPPPLPARPNGNYPGLGWPTVVSTPKGFGYFHDGNWFGMRTLMKRNPSRGLNSVLLFNVSIQPDPIDNQIVLDAAREIQEQVEKIKDYPNVDLFESHLRND